MDTIQFISKESSRFKKLLFRSSLGNNYLPAILLAGILIIESIFYIETSVNHRFESLVSILDPLLPSENAGK